MIYLDNSATTYPKPRQVVDAVCGAFEKYGANPGRGGYAMSEATAKEIYDVRAKAAEMFNAPSEEHVVFTMNCTHGLNMAIKGSAKRAGHAVTSCLEHNSVYRPLKKLEQEGVICFDMVAPSADRSKIVRSFERRIRKNTDFIICTSACNVFGDIMPVTQIGSIAKKYNIPFIVDAAQGAGILDIDMKRDNISCLCMPGHKGLYGPVGTGMMILNDDVMLNTIMEGGTGSESKNYKQPEMLPDRFESGTVNTCGIIGLGKGLDFVKETGISNIFEHESELIGYLYEKLQEMDHIILYQNYNPRRYSPVLAFNIEGKTGEETASLLNQDDIAVRGGFHCNPCAHQFYHTGETGAVRVSVSCFTTKKDIDFLINSLIKIVKTV